MLFTYNYKANHHDINKIMFILTNGGLPGMMGSESRAGHAV